MNRALRTSWLALVAVLLIAGLAWAQPTEPINPQPDGSEPVGPRPVLSWEGGDDPGGGSVRYFIDLGGEADCPGARTVWSKRTKKKHWRIPARQQLPPDTTYSWTVRARTADGEDISEIWTFTTGSYPFICEIIPEMARPTYAVDILGRHFGEKRGAVKLGRRWLDGQWGKIIRWTDERITVVLPCYQCWGTLLPNTFILKVRSAAGQTSNFAKIYIGWGGGGTTW